MISFEVLCYLNGCIGTIGAYKTLSCLLIALLATKISHVPCTFTYPSLLRFIFHRYMHRMLKYFEYDKSNVKTLLAYRHRSCHNLLNCSVWEFTRSSKTVLYSTHYL